MAAKLDSKPIILAGSPVNSGKVAAPACLYSSHTHRSVKEYGLDSDTAVEEEQKRFRGALRACSEELDGIYDRVSRDVGRTEAEIFLTQKHIMNDPAIIGAIEENLRQKRKNVESVIVSVYRGYEEKFALLDDEYLRERSTDIGEIRRRLIDTLHKTKPGFKCHGQAHCTRGRNRIIVAEELTADMMARMDLEAVQGIVTEHGGITSHAAIIARSVGVPAVSGVRGVMSLVECGMKILVDGDEGQVVLMPTEQMVKELIPVDIVLSGDVCLIKSPPGTEVMANASHFEDVRMATRVNADGIGLFRTEINFMRANRLLTEDEQFELYKKVVDEMGERPVTFRLMDVGGDKQLSFLKIGEEENPSLGWRGARFLLGSPGILSAQAAALVRVSRYKPVRIMFPMIVDSRQTAELCNFVREFLTSREGNAENLRIGVMFEVPSACVQAESILNLVDFASIGSNDLIQYLFAVDRNNELVSQDFNPDHPALWSVMQSLSDAAKKTGKPLSICGEMAGREGVASRLWDTGIRSVSVSARFVPRVRNELAAHTGDKDIKNAG